MLEFEKLEVVCLEGEKKRGLKITVYARMNSIKINNNNKVE